jgi:ribosomal protein S18 acetylase RimI-like enzyme
MPSGDQIIELRQVTEWDTAEVVALYAEGGWWRDEWDAMHIPALISGSFIFLVAIDHDTGRAIGMGRVISDGVSDAYIQDVVVHTEFRGRGLGTRIISNLTGSCRAAGIVWIGCIAEPGTEGIYRTAGFEEMKGHTPMILKSD